MIVRSVMHDILATGVEAGASDWHIREGSSVGLRVDGRLVEIDFVTTREFLDEAMAQLTNENQMATYERTGDSDFAFAEEDVGRFRANLHKQRGLMSLTLRHVKSKVPDASKLGLPRIVLKIAENKNGIIFVTGTTGSGKSTTLGCMIEHQNSNFTRHIITIEDPIEYAFVDKNSIIEQREVGLDCITFDSALIHALRQDPDVIIVGEMRNKDTFETALHAAETGHLVMTTLHTQDAAQSVYRILDMYPHEEREAVRKSLAKSLRAIISQRLVPRATGQGVVPAVDILINVPIVRKLIQDGRLDKLGLAIEGGAEDGMVSLNRCLLGLINDGIITEEAGLATSDNAEALQMNLRGIFLSDGGGIIG